MSPEGTTAEAALPPATPLEMVWSLRDQLQAGTRSEDLDAPRLCSAYLARTKRFSGRPRPPPTWGRQSTRRQPCAERYHRYRRATAGHTGRSYDFEDKESESKEICIRLLNVMRESQDLRPPIHTVRRTNRHRVAGIQPAGLSPLRLCYLHGKIGLSTASTDWTTDLSQLIKAMTKLKPVVLNVDRADILNENLQRATLLRNLQEARKSSEKIDEKIFDVLKMGGSDRLDWKDLRESTSFCRPHCRRQAEPGTATIAGGKGVPAKSAAELSCQCRIRSPNERFS